jgi:flavin reductase (DIM6/NTAB) family NADH-FMN oxidoreductase RutF
MFVDLRTQRHDRPSIFNSLVVPRPIAWVSTVDADGLANLAPFSYFNLLASSPATVVFSCVNAADRDEKDTLSNIRATRQFVVNLVSRELLEAMHATSAPALRGVDEFELAGIARAAGTCVDAPRVLAAPAALECRLLQFLELPPEHQGELGATAVVGRVVGLHVADEFLDAQGRFDSVRACLVSRLGGPQYAGIGDITEIAPVSHGG